MQCARTSNSLFSLGKEEKRDMMEGLKAEPSTAMSGSLEPSDESKLQITVRDGEGGQMTFRVRKSTKLKKLMSNYCEKQGVAYGTYRFTLDGKRINENDTAETLQMEDGDCIDAFLYQQGGARCESE